MKIIGSFVKDSSVRNGNDEELWNEKTEANVR
jgi:hypothetical protein